MQPALHRGSMTKPILAAAFLLSLVLPAGSTSAAGAGPPVIPDVAAGQRVANEHCASCHSLGKGSSPWPAAPRFRDLHARYGPGGLRQLLGEGMIAQDPPPEEGPSPRHPSMPAAVLGADEVDALAAYLKSLQPPSRGPRPS